MNPILNLLPSAGAAFALFFSSFPVDDFSSSSLGTPTVQQEEFAPPNPDQNAKSTKLVSELLAPSTPRNSRRPALISPQEPDFDSGQTSWIKSQISELQEQSAVLNSGFLGVPLVPSVALAIQVTGQRTRIAFQDTAKADGTVPAPKQDAYEVVNGAEDKVPANAATKEQEPVERRHGRVRLLKGLVYRGWDRSTTGPKTAAQDEQTSRIPPAGVVSEPQDVSVDESVTPATP